MSTSPPPLKDPKLTSDFAMEQLNATWNATFDTVKGRSNDPVLAQQHAAKAVAEALRNNTQVKMIIDTGFTIASSVLADFFDAISKFRSTTASTFGESNAAILNDYLGTSLTADQLKPAGSGNERQQAAQSLGAGLLDSLEKFFAPSGAVTPDSGATAARGFSGLAMSLSLQNSLLTIMGGCIPQLHLDEIRELGDSLTESLGIGRLMRLALRPLIDNTISKPYGRQMAAKYQQDLLSASELALAILSGRIDEAKGRDLLHQHGLNDEMIAELFAQKLPRLSEAEEELLIAMGTAPAGDDFYHSKTDGAPDEVRAARLKLLTWRRLGPERGRVLSAILSEISNGFVPASDLDTVMQRLGLPADEQDLWRQAAGFLGERTRKRLNQGDMLFLYEAAQVTLDEVGQWAKDEGYSDTDVQRVQLFFSLKAAEATQKSTGGSAARASHLHAEHVAWITDEITGLFGRAPSSAELTFWVTLLDQGARTKHDVMTELKALDTGGSAIPPK